MNERHHYDIGGNRREVWLKRYFLAPNPFVFGVDERAQSGLSRDALTGNVNVKTARFEIARRDPCVGVDVTEADRAAHGVPKHARRGAADHEAVPVNRLIVIQQRLGIVEDKPH